MAYFRDSSLNILITTQSSATVRSQERSYSGAKTAEFAHDAHQLIVVARGAVIVGNNSGTCAVAAGRAAWIPARMRHSIEPAPSARVRTLYIYGSRPPSRLRRFGGSCQVLELGPLLRAIADHIHHHGADKHLTAVLIDQLAAARELPLFVPALSSAIGKRVAEVLMADPSDQPRIRDLAGELRVSDRTLERAFAADAGMPVGEWRQRARISRAIGLLAAGMDVKDVALEVGYETPSAFVVAFKKYAGMTPGKLTATKNTKGNEAHEVL